MLCQINQPSVILLCACLGAGDPEVGPDLEGITLSTEAESSLLCWGSWGLLQVIREGFLEEGTLNRHLPPCKPARPGMRRNQGTARLSSERVGGAVATLNSPSVSPHYSLSSPTPSGSFYTTHR